MKTKTYIATILLTLCGSLTAALGHDHDHGNKNAPKAGPNGGRLIATVSPRAEFFVTADHFAQITFVNENGEVIAPDQQVVSLIGGERSNPIKLTFAATDGVLRSSEALPDQPRMPIILSIKATPDAKAVREKFYLNLGQCGSCDYQEYACICGH